ncbi:Mitochondrial import receptor subunit TOM20 homolog, partial [Lemmus lemmus]
VGWKQCHCRGLCGALFIRYCIYFDHKRQSDPNFKNRLLARDHENSVDHLRNAIAVCGQPQSCCKCYSGLFHHQGSRCF